MTVITESSSSSFSFLVLSNVLGIVGYTARCVKSVLTNAKTTKRVVYGTKNYSKILIPIFFFDYLKKGPRTIYSIDLPFIVFVALLCSTELYVSDVLVTLCMHVHVTHLS